MAGKFQELYTQRFGGGLGGDVLSARVNHNLNRVVCAARVIVDGEVRNEIVDSIIPSESDPRNVFVVNFNTASSGVIQVVDSDYIWTSLPTPEGASALGNNLSGSAFSGSFTGSFSGDGSNLTGIEAGIIVQDSGDTISGGPYSTLNFTGELSASNSGGGIAEIGVNLPDSIFVDYFNSVAYSGITTTPSTLPLDTTRQNNSAFSRNGGEVTVNTAGTYRVDYDCSTSDDTFDDNTIEVWLELNTGSGFAEVAGTRSRFFHDSGNEEGGNHGMAILTLAESDILRIRAQVVDGSGQIDTLANSVRLLLMSIGSNGAAGPQGPQGPAGSGTTITVQDEGSNIANTPNSKLNFVGSGVTATDGGSGVATITIPGAPPVNIAQYRQTNNLAISTSPTTVDLDFNDFEDSFYSRSGQNITVNTAGIYRISYSIFFDTLANARRTVEAWVENNSTEIIPSRAGGYSRNNTDDTASLSATFLVELSASDVVRLRCQSTGTFGSPLGIANRMWLTIEFVRTP